MAIDMTPKQLSRPRLGLIVLAGFLALVVAMGIGRFAFTPMLPLMQRDGALGTSTGAWLAAANYAGYFAGALCAAYVRITPHNLIRFSLVPIAVFTAAMGLTGGLTETLLPWLLLRFAAGVFSAWVLVGTSAWCLAQIAPAGRPALAGPVYAGVGAGIAIAGALCLALARTTAATLWLYMGAIAAVLSLAVWGLIWRAGGEQSGALGGAATTAPVATPASATSERGLVVCYGVLGFGYILPATFIPALGRMVIDDPVLFGWAWPVFGATAALSTVLASVLLGKLSRLVVLSRSYYVMAVGAALPALWPSLPALLVSAVCVGGTFMVSTMAGYQEARARAGSNPTRLMGLMTSAFALGQIAGPLSSALLAHLPLFDEQTSLRGGLVLAAIALVAAGIWLQRAAVSARSTPISQGAQA